MKILIFFFFFNNFVNCGISKCYLSKSAGKQSISLPKSRNTEPVTHGEASTGRSAIPFFCISLVTVTTAVKKKLFSVHHGADIGKKYLTSLSAEPLQCSPWEIQTQTCSSRSVKPYLVFDQWHGTYSFTLSSDMEEYLSLWMVVWSKENLLSKTIKCENKCGLIS